MKYKIENCYVIYKDGSRVYIFQLNEIGCVGIFHYSLKKNAFEVKADQSFESDCKLYIFLALFIYVVYIASLVTLGDDIDIDIDINNISINININININPFSFLSLLIVVINQHH